MLHLQEWYASKNKGVKYCQSVRMERYLQPGDVLDQGSAPFILTSNFTKGGKLTIDPYKKIKVSSNGYDDRWSLIPHKDNEDFLILSSKDKNLLCHNLTDEGEVDVRPLSDNTEGCVWKIGKRGELYQPHPSGGERYLWTVNDTLYVTLADKWYSPGKEEIQLPSNQENHYLVVILVLTVLIIMLI